MDLEKFRGYCLAHKGVTEEFPFGGDTLVYKVKGKIFALARLCPFDSMNLKCDPEKAVALRETYPAVKPGYHMNKTHWNTVQLNTGLPDQLVLEWIHHSYELVVNALPRKLREDMLNQPGTPKP